MIINVIGSFNDQKNAAVKIDKLKKMEKLAAIKHDDCEPVFTFNVTAQKYGVIVPTLRKYEKGGLIIPCRNKSGHRLHSFADLRRISYI